MYLFLCCPATHRTRKRIDGLLQQFSVVEEQGLKTNKTRIAVLVVSSVYSATVTLQYAGEP